MLVQERQPVLYTSTSNDWSAASIILAGVVVAMLGFLLYYFSIMHAVEMTRLPAGPPQTVLHEMSAIPAPAQVPHPDAATRASAR
ncbi:MAG TPA: hypothetical protein V6C81_28100 [Planktothrix sp.]|jgi:hypothetical protein